MDDFIVASLLILFGFLLSMVACCIGARLACELLTGKKGLLSFTPEPQGEVFTIEDPDEAALFPEENVGGKGTEEHILKRTEKFLQTLGGNKQ